MVRNIKRKSGLLGLAWLGLAGWLAAGITLTTDYNVNNPIEGIAPTFVNNTVVYDFTTNVLDMDIFNIANPIRSNAWFKVLSLTNQGGGNFNFFNLGTLNTGDLAIQSTNSIWLRKVDTSTGANGGDIRLSSFLGSVGAMMLDSRNLANGSGNRSAGNIDIQAPLGHVVIGEINASALDDGGRVTIGSGNGMVQVAGGIDVRGGLFSGDLGGSVSIIAGNGSVAVASNIVALGYDRTQGVLIQASSISVGSGPGNRVDTSSQELDAGDVWMYASGVDGIVARAHIDTTADLLSPNFDDLGGAVSLWAPIGDVVVVGDIDTRGGQGGDIVVTGVSVRVSGGLNAQALVNANNQFGGDIRVNALAGSIRVDGPPNANARRGDAFDGGLDLRASNGWIRIGGLDLNNFSSTIFAVGSGEEVTIDGPLSNLLVVGNNASGFGSINSHVYYNAGFNPALYGGGINGRYDITDSGGGFDLIPLSGIANTSAGGVTPSSAVFSATMYNTGETFQVVAYWGDAEGGTNPAGWGQSGSVGVFSFNGVSNISYLAVNPLNLFETNYFTFRMTNAMHDVWARPGRAFVAGQGPVIDQALFGDLAVLPGASYNGLVPAMLQNGIPLHHWELNQGPAGMTINTNSGQVTWPIPINGIHLIEIAAVNPWGADTSSWTLVVTDTLTMTNDSAVAGDLFCDVFDVPANGPNPYTYSALVNFNMAGFNISNPTSMNAAIFRFGTLTNGNGGNFLFSGPGTRGDLRVESAGRLHLGSVDNSSASGHAGSIRLRSIGASLGVASSLMARGVSAGNNGGNISVTAGVARVGGVMDASGDNAGGYVDLFAFQVALGADANGDSIVTRSLQGDAGNVLIEALFGDVAIIGRIDASASYGDAADFGGQVDIVATNGLIHVGGGIDASSGGDGTAFPIVLDGASIMLGLLDGTNSVRTDSGVRDGAPVTLTARTGDIQLDGSINTMGGAPGGRGEMVTLSALNGMIVLGGGIEASGYSLNRPISLTASDIQIGGDVNGFSLDDNGADVAIVANGGSINIGGRIDVHAGTASADQGGQVTLTALNGPITIGGGVFAYGGNQDANPLRIDGRSVSIGLAVNEGIRTDTVMGDQNDAGDVTVIARNGDVRIGGSIEAFAFTNSTSDKAGIVMLFASNGVVDVKRSILAYGGDEALNAGDVQVVAEGIVIGRNLSHGIFTYNGREDAGSISLTALNGNVSVSGDLDTRALEAGGAEDGGDITITATGGDVFIGGTIDANSAVGDAMDGDLCINTDGSITIGHLDATRVNLVKLNAGGGLDQVTINGLLTGFTVVGSNVSGFDQVNSDVFYNQVVNPGLAAGGTGATMRLSETPDSSFVPL